MAARRGGADASSRLPATRNGPGPPRHQPSLASIEPSGRKDAKLPPPGSRPATSTPRGHSTTASRSDPWSKPSTGEVGDVVTAHPPRGGEAPPQAASPAASARTTAPNARHITRSYE